MFRTWSGTLCLVRLVVRVYRGRLRRLLVTDVNSIELVFGWGADCVTDLSKVVRIVLDRMRLALTLVLACL